MSSVLLLVVEELVVPLEVPDELVVPLEVPEDDELVPLAAGGMPRGGASHVTTPSPSAPGRVG